MSRPWGYGPKQFTVERGSDQLIELGVPRNGKIKSINLQQQGDSNDGVFEIFDSEQAARVLADAGAASSSVSYSSEDIPGAEPAAHSVTAGQVSISGGAYRANDLDIPYANRDGSPTNGVRRLWMIVNFTGSGSTSFSLGMTIEPTDLSG